MNDNLIAITTNEKNTFYYSLDTYNGQSTIKIL